MVVLPGAGEHAACLLDKRQNGARFVAQRQAALANRGACCRCEHSVKHLRFRVLTVELVQRPRACPRPSDEPFAYKLVQREFCGTRVDPGDAGSISQSEGPMLVYQHPKHLGPRR
jgi:hypothetical protein